MSDIADRLRGLADLFEAGDAPRHLVLHMRAGADEIERLRTRLEVDPSHPYDGIYCRDETIRGLEKQIASLLTTLADERTESMRLRAALGLFACDCIESGNLCPSPQNCRNYIARAALEEGLSCTCHPVEAPTPCQRKYALGDCIKAALEEGRT